MGISLKIYLNNGKYLQGGDWIPTLDDDDCVLSDEYLTNSYDMFPGNRGLSNFQSSQDESISIDLGGPNWSGAGSSLTSTPQILPWNFRDRKDIRLNELFWPTQLQRHAELYVAIPYGLTSGFTYEDWTMINRTGVAFVSVGIGDPDWKAFNLRPEGFIMYVAGAWSWDSDTRQPAPPGTLAATSILLKLVDQRYFWNTWTFRQNEITESGSSGLIPDPVEYWDLPQYIKPTAEALRIISSWKSSYDPPYLEFTNDPLRLNVYQNQFGFTIYPYSVPSSGIRRGLMSDWVAWTQGYVPVVYPNFDSLNTAQYGYAVLGLAPAFLSQYSLHPADHKDFHLGTKNAPFPDGDPGDGTHAIKLQTFGNPVFPHSSKSVAGFGYRGVIGRGRIDLRENDILYGDYFITSRAFPAEDENVIHWDSPSHDGHLIANPGKAAEALAYDVAHDVYNTPVIEINTALFSNEIFDTSDITACELQSIYPAPGDQYFPYNGAFAYPGGKMLVDAIYRIKSQYEYMMFIAQHGGNSYHHFGSYDHTQDFEDNHNILWTQGPVEGTQQQTTPRPIRGPFFHVYDCMYIRGDNSTRTTGGRFNAYRSFSATRLAYRADAVPREFPVTWCAPDEVTKKFGAGTSTKHLVLDMIDNGGQIYAEGKIVIVDGDHSDTSYFLAVERVLPAETGDGAFDYTSVNFRASPIIRLYRPDLWPYELSGCTKVSALRIPRKSQVWWDRQWVPIAKEC